MSEVVLYDHTGNQIKGAKPNRYVNNVLSGWQAKNPLSTDKDYTALLNGYNSWVYVFASRNATSVAQANLRLYVAKPAKGMKSKRFLTKTIDDEKYEWLMEQSHIRNIPAVQKAMEIDEVLEHPLLDVFRNVNNFMNSFDLWETTQLHLELTGNAYWLLLNNGLGKPQEIWPLPPDRMRIIPDPDTFISGYEYTGDTFKKVRFREDQIIHFKFIHPKTPFYGFGSLAAVIPAANVNAQMNEYENSVFRNNGRVEGGFETSEQLDEDEFRKLKREIRDLYVGVRNAGATPLFDNGLTYKNYGLSPRDLAFIEGRELIKEELAAAFGQTLGLWSAEATRANAEAAMYQHAKSSILPRCIRLAEKLNEKLVPRYDSALFFQWDNVVPSDRKLELTEQTMRVKSGLTTINEERAKMRMKPIEGGDNIFMQMQMVPLSTVLTGGNLKNQIDNNAPKKPTPEDKKELKRRIAELLKEGLK